MPVADANMPSPPMARRPGASAGAPLPGPSHLGASQPGVSTPSSRGFAVPFTGALLCGTRLRPTPHVRFEFLLPNREGTRGYALLDWVSLRESHAPTLHDIRLAQFLHRLKQITPATIHAAALVVAGEGLVGEAAAALASRRNILERNRIARRLVLLRRLAARIGATAWACGPIPAAGLPDTLAWEAAGVHRVAQLSNLPQETVARALDDLSRAFLCVGHVGTSRPVRLITLLRTCQTDWALQADDAAQRLAGLMAEAARPEDIGRDALSRLATACERLSALAMRALDAATRQFALSEAACEDVGLLLDLWRSDPDAPAALAAPLMLALDGWERICLLWHARPASASAADVTEVSLVAAELALMAALLPVGADAVVEPAQPAAPAGAEAVRPRDMRLLATGPRRGEALALCVARNERARLAELELDMVDETLGSGEER